MKAGTYDLTVETGASFELAVRVYAPTGTPVAAAALLPGDRVYYGELPEYVYDTDTWSQPGSQELVTVKLRHGLWNDPKFTVVATDLVRTAAPVELRTAQLGITYAVKPPDTPYVQPLTFPTPPPPPTETRLLIPTSIEDGATVVAQWTDEETHALTAGTYDWDLYVHIDADGSWIRLLEGLLMVVRGATRNEEFFDD